MPRRAARMDEARQILRSRLNFQGTQMGFSTERNDALWWLMLSGDVNAARAVLVLLDDTWLAGRPPAHDARPARSSAARTLGHDDRQRLGRARDGQVQRRVRENAGLRSHASPPSANPRAQVAWPADDAAASISFPWPAVAASLTLAHEGAGRPWAFVESRAALPLTAPLFTGYAIRRTITPIEQASKDAWTRGDVVRVRLEIDAQSDMGWVVVEDPVPAGASILGGGLGRDSSDPYRR